MLDPATTVIGSGRFIPPPWRRSAPFVEAMLPTGPARREDFPGTPTGRLPPRRRDTSATLDPERASRAVRAVLAAGCPAVLVAHVRYRALDPELPGSLSPAVVTGLLRQHLGFDGFILSDDLEMAAVAGTWGVADAERRILDAGGDIELICRSESIEARRWRPSSAKSSVASTARPCDGEGGDPPPIDAAGRRPDVSGRRARSTRAAEEVGARSAAGLSVRSWVG